MKRILLGLITISLVSIIGIGATRAYFSNEGTSTGNTFSAGTLDLKLTDANETNQDNVTASWAGSDMTPGGSAVSGSVDLKNTGTVQGNHVEVAAANTCDDTSEDMDTYLEITSLLYDGGNILGTMTDNNENGWKDLDDLETVGLDDLALADSGTHNFSMDVKLNENAGDDYQGKSCTTVFTFTLNQDAIQ